MGYYQKSEYMYNGRDSYINVVNPHINLVFDGHQWTAAVKMNNDPPTVIPYLVNDWGLSLCPTDRLGRPWMYYVDGNFYPDKLLQARCLYDGTI